jgi:hypothetical protein
MKQITNNQLTKIKQIEKQLGIDLDTDNMSEFEAHQIIISNKKFHSQQTKPTKNVPDELKIQSGSSYSVSGNKTADILIKKVNLTEKEKEEYDY